MNKNIKPRGSHSHSINVFFLKFLKSSQENDGRLTVLPEVISIAEKVFEHLVTPDSKTHKVSLFSYFFLSWTNLLKYIFEETQAVSGTLLWWLVWALNKCLFFILLYELFFSSNKHKKANCPVVQRSTRGNLKD